MRILIAGCGDIGTALGVELATAGHEVGGLRRRPEGLPAAIRPLRADLTRPATLVGLPPAIDVIVYTASSTAVYGQTDGSWVDETSPTKPWNFRGRRLLEAERLLAALPVPATVVRLGGIYGPGRTRLVDRLRRGEAACVEGSPRYGNRIHRDDYVGTLRHVVELARPASVYLAVDHEPADECEVLRWLARQLGLPDPPVVPAGGPSRRGNKRCRNDRLVASGYRFRYPTFREGYAVEVHGLAHRDGPAATSRPGGHGGSERGHER